MKLIMRVLLWGGLGVAALAGLAELVDEGFARHFAMPVLGAFLLIGLILGIRVTNRDRREKQQKAQALRETADSTDQKTAWANELKKRAADAAALCNRNNQLKSGNLLFSAEYEAEDELEELTSTWTDLLNTQARLRAAVQQMEQERETL